MFSAYSDLRSLNYFDMRLKFLSLLMLFVMIVSISTILSRFGGIGIIEDNFVGQLSTAYKSSAHFMCFYGMINFYVITMAYVYSPTAVTSLSGDFASWSQFQRTNFMFPTDNPVMKDNPAFSMINDSDEDVIYDEDDSRRPLNCSKKTNDYDSD